MAVKRERAVLSYGCQAWTMTQSSEEQLAKSERKILGRVFQQVYENKYDIMKSSVIG